jgi:hypothetical protein
MEVDTGSAHRPSLPFWTWPYQADHFVVIIVMERGYARIARRKQIMA